MMNEDLLLLLLEYLNISAREWAGAMYSLGMEDSNKKTKPLELGNNIIYEACKNNAIEKHNNFLKVYRDLRIYIKASDQPQ